MAVLHCLARTAMTVVVNAVAAKMGGAANYLRELAGELARRPAAGRFIFYVPPEQAEAGRGLPTHIEWRVTPAGRGGALRRLWWDHVTLRRILRREGADALYCTANFATFFSPVPQLLLVRNSVYFSDLYQRTCLGRWGWGFRLAYWLRRWLICRSAAAADQVTTPSATMLDALRRATSLQASKTGVNPYGVSAPDKPLAAPSTNSATPIRLLCPVVYGDHKDIHSVVEALRLLQERAPGRFHLTTTADPKWELARAHTRTWRRDAELLAHPRLASAVTILGLVPRERLLELYAAADIVIYPTLTESFGQPLLEALALGVPVVASDIPVNRELAGDAALYFEPLDPAQLAARIEELAADATLRATLRERGRQRAQQLSWARHTEQLVERLAALARAAGAA